MLERTQNPRKNPEEKSDLRMKKTKIKASLRIKVMIRRLHQTRRRKIMKLKVKAVKKMERKMVTRMNPRLRTPRSSKKRKSLKRNEKGI